MITLRPPLRALRFLKGSEAPPWRSTDDRVAVCWFSLGRDALGSIADRLARIADAVMWLPAYSCQQAKDPFASRGIRIEWYDVEPDLQVNWGQVLDARRRVRGTHALLFIDYFGFPQEMPARVRGDLERGFSVVVRDAAHGVPYAGEEIVLGREGGYLVHSLRKPIPIPEGSPLHVHGEGPIASPSVDIRDWLRSRAFFAYEYLGLGAPRLAGVPWFARGRAVLKQRRRYGTRPLMVTRWMAERIDFEHVRRSRQANAACLLESLHPFALANEIGPCTCPYYLPLLVRDVAPVEAAFRDVGIEVTRFWSADSAEGHAARSSVASWITQHLLCLPVHQGLASSDLERISETARRALARAHPSEKPPTHGSGPTTSWNARPKEAS